MTSKTSGEKSPTVKEVLKVDPCEECKRQYDKKSPFCKSCINYKDK